MTIEIKVKEVISKIMADVNIEDVLPESSLAGDLGADSLTIVELVMAIEESFDIEIDETQAGKLLTVQDITNFIKARS